MTAEHFDNAPSGYFAFLDNAALEVINNTACNLLGRTKEELQHQNVETIFTLSTRIFFQTHFLPLVKLHGHAEEIFLSLLTKEGDHLPVLLNAKRNDSAEQPYTACSFIVVAHRKKFEDELIEARRKAETALSENTALLKAQEQLKNHTEQLHTNMRLVNKQNGELKQLNHVITHSLKEPVRKVLLFADKLSGYQWPAEVEETLSRLLRSSSQMRSTVHGLQQYVWLDDHPCQFSPVDLRQVISRAAEKLRKESVNDELLLQMDFFPSIDGDDEQLQLLFYHLLSNAVKYKKAEKAEVLIRSTIIQQNRFHGIDTSYEYADFLQIEIIDRGTGFDPAASDAVFELFRKLDRGSGIGLGLALCRRIAENHLGVIRAWSRPGVETVFTLLLPIKHFKEPAKPDDAGKGLTPPSV